MKKRKGFDYRRFYSDKMGGLKWNTKDFHVHHIDLDYNNNSFDNLVLIPSKIHNRFHYIINALDGDIESLVRFTSRRVITDYEIKMIAKYLDVKRIISNYIMIKELLLTLYFEKLDDMDFQEIIENDSSISYLRW